MKKSLRMLAIVPTMALLVSACGSSGSASTKSTTKAQPAASGQSSTGMALATTMVNEFSQAPASSLGITQSVSVPKTGLNVVYIECAQVVCQSIGTGIAEAVAAAGGKYTVFHDQDTASTVATAFDDAIQAHPSMVLTSGDPEQWFTPQLAQLKSMGVPVIAWSLPCGYTDCPSIAANLITGDDYWFQGTLMADYAAVKMNGKANILFVNVPQYPVLATEGEGVASQLPKVCPTCHITNLNFTVSDLLAGNANAAILATIQKNPGINFIIGGFGGILSGALATSLKSAGYGQIKAISQAGTSANYQLIASGQLQEADLGLPTTFLGWRAVDAGLRAMAHQPVGTFTKVPNTTFASHPNVLVTGLPLRFLTSSVITDPQQAWNPIPNFQAQFKKLWGLG